MCRTGDQNRWLLAAHHLAGCLRSRHLSVALQFDQSALLRRLLHATCDLNQLNIATFRAFANRVNLRVFRKVLLNAMQKTVHVGEKQVVQAIRANDKIVNQRFGARLLENTFYRLISVDCRHLFFIRFLGCDLR